MLRQTPPLEAAEAFLVAARTASFRAGATELRQMMCLVASEPIEAGGEIRWNQQSAGLGRWAPARREGKGGEGGLATHRLHPPWWLSAPAIPPPFCFKSYILLFFIQQ